MLLMEVIPGHPVRINAVHCRVFNSALRAQTTPLQAYIHYCKLRPLPFSIIVAGTLLMFTGLYNGCKGDNKGIN